MESGVIIFLDLWKCFEHSKVTIFTNLKRSSTKFKGSTENLVRYYDLKIAICWLQKFGKLNKDSIDCNHFTDFDKSWLV